MTASRTRLIRAATFTVLLLGQFGRLVLADAAEPRRTNVLFLFADDQRTDTIAALGNPHIQTPTLDALVRRGFVFRNAYCLGSNSPAVCLPSRNMLMSGRAFHRWNGPQAPADGPNFPTTLKQAGYETYHHGKRGNVALQIQALFEHNKYLMDQQDRTSGEPGKQIVDEAIEFLGRGTKAGRSSCIWHSPIRTIRAWRRPGTWISTSGTRFRCRRTTCRCTRSTTASNWCATSDWLPGRGRKTKSASICTTTTR